MDLDTSSPTTTTLILLVEDYADIALLLRMMLERRGYHVEVASTLQSAELLFATHSFDLIISDIMLPDGTGWELLPRLRASKPVKAIAFSAFSSDADIERSRQAGFFCHLAKPVRPAQLLSTIRKALLELD